MFDRKVVDQLLKYVPFYPKGTEVKLTDGRSGIIYENSGIHNLRPIVRLFDGNMIDLAEKGNLNITIQDPEWQGEVSQEELELERLEMIKPAC